MWKNPPIVDQLPAETMGHGFSTSISNIMVPAITEGIADFQTHPRVNSDGEGNASNGS
jgi:hypothetical protein